MALTKYKESKMTKPRGNQVAIDSMVSLAEAFTKASEAVDDFGKAWRKAERQRKRHEWWNHFHRPWNRARRFFARAWKWLVEWEEAK